MPAETEDAHHWSCPLCTLLNTADDERCAACDNARPRAYDTQPSRSTEAMTAASSASHVRHTFRPTPGVFFASFPSEQGGGSAWRHEPRLAVNRNCRKRQRKDPVEYGKRCESEWVEAGTRGQDASLTASDNAMERTTHGADQVRNTFNEVERFVTTEDATETFEEEEAIPMEEPCFNLLGPGAAVFNVDTPSIHNDREEVVDTGVEATEKGRACPKSSMSVTTPSSLHVRPELKVFEHFVCIEDLRSDLGCRINYHKMFAGQRSGKLYVDRLAKRRAESRQRERKNATQNQACRTPTSTARSGKSVRDRKKRKATPKQPRGSEKAKRAKKTRASPRRGTCAPKASAHINHYDDSMAELGDDLSTMAWEGIGSAGYL
ncbi:hypothetical protein PsorP6_016851 [Peronosclerospora sorghi]|uniref:Uncharacterized protein n=1 Tax=Peronosclerospora sorghi TaxID=230839 RepID=A0ACC0WE15_9STRA|nr:hypothetical protein PsorP6_016851 [Peronosclerospora sorghi]